MYYKSKINKNFLQVKENLLSLFWIMKSAVCGLLCFIFIVSGHIQGTTKYTQLPLVLKLVTSEQLLNHFYWWVSNWLKESKELRNKKKKKAKITRERREKHFLSLLSLTHRLTLKVSTMRHRFKGTDCIFCCLFPPPFVCTRDNHSHLLYQPSSPSPCRGSSRSRTWWCVLDPNITTWLMGRRSKPLRDSDSIKRGRSQIFGPNLDGPEIGR